MTTLTTCAIVALSLASSVYTTPLSTNPVIPSPRRSFVPAEILDVEHPHGTISDSYIVVLKKELSVALVDNHLNFLQAAHNADPFDVEAASAISHVYSPHMNAYAGKFTASVLEQIRHMPEVDYIERDQIVKTQNITTQKGAPWGLARISHRPKLTLGTFTKYLYDPKGGEGVDVYVVDTGINIKHVEFEGRAKWGSTIPQNDVDEDGNGHGTHCAGTIASKKYGVAKAANVIAVKVLGSNGSGSMSDVVQGVSYAATEAQKKAKAADDEYAATGSTKHKGSVANMSLGGGKSKVLDDAVNRAVRNGLHFAVAAGNDNKDACSYSPAAAEEAVTVGASTLQDDRAYFSNHGKCVDVFAPGLNILSTWTGSPTATNTISGTSMASPHTAGLLAYLLSIYPSKQFSPVFDESTSTFELTTPTQGFFSSDMYALAHAVLPRWVSGLLPLVRSAMDAPTPEAPKKITPAQLKNALVALSSKGLLKDLNAETPNLLIFSNATAV